MILLTTFDTPPPAPLPRRQQGGEGDAGHGRTDDGSDSLHSVELCIIAFRLLSIVIRRRSLPASVAVVGDDDDTDTCESEIHKVESLGMSLTD